MFATTKASLFNFLRRETQNGKASFPICTRCPSQNWSSANTRRRSLAASTAMMCWCMRTRGLEDCCGGRLAATQSGAREFRPNICETSLQLRAFIAALRFLDFIWARNQTSRHESQTKRCPRCSVTATGVSQPHRPQRPRGSLCGWCKVRRGGGKTPCES